MTITLPAKSFIHGTTTKTRRLQMLRDVPVEIATPPAAESDLQVIRRPDPGIVEARSAHAG